MIDVILVQTSYYGIEFPFRLPYLGSITLKSSRLTCSMNSANSDSEIILIIDADTIVPEDCFRDAAREMFESPDVAIIRTNLVSIFGNGTVINQVQRRCRFTYLTP